MPRSRPASRRWCSGCCRLRVDGPQATRNIGSSLAAAMRPTTAASRKAMAAEHRQHGVQRGRIAGHQQAAAGLRVGQQGPVLGGEARGQRHLGAVAGPVAARRAGDEALRRQRAHARQQRHARPSRSAPRSRAPRAISSAWPARPKPVTSVSACTPGSAARSGPGVLSLRRAWRSSARSRRRPARPSSAPRDITPTPSGLPSTSTSPGARRRCA